jgi:hypothetical protein
VKKSIVLCPALLAVIAGGELACAFAQDLGGLAVIRPGKSRAVTSADPNPESNADRIKYIVPGETKILAQRLLPNLDIVTEGKAMLPTAKHSPGVLELQKGYDWTGDGQILFMPAMERPEIEVEFNIEKEEYRGLIVRLRERWLKKRKLLG